MATTRTTVKLTAIHPPQAAAATAVPPPVSARKGHPIAMVNGVEVTLTALGLPIVPRVKDKNRPNLKPPVTLHNGVTRSQTDAIAGAFEHFNRELFDGQLPPVLLNFSRHANCYGFFAANRWYDAANREVVAHEISLNPTEMQRRDIRATYSTLVHEMVHLWQEEYGKKKSKRGYHNDEWASKMESVGLIPTSTGQPDGNRTGYKVSHMVVNGGAYDRAFALLSDELKIPWICEDPLKAEAKPRKKSKVKYTCPDCEFNAWAKPNASVMCGECEVKMTPEDDEDDEDTEQAAEAVAWRSSIADGGR